MANLVDAQWRFKTIWYYSRPRAHYPLVATSGGFFKDVPPLQTLWKLTRSHENAF